MQSPKPRIRKRHGVWYCGTPWQLPGVVLPVIVGPYGEGYSPSEALKDWKAQQ
jgi:hypothetical protein